MDDLLEITLTREGNAYFVTPLGQIDMQTMRPLREALRPLPDEGIRYIVFDLRDVSFLDSAGMSLLLGTRKRVAEHGGECYLVTTPDSILDRSLTAVSIDKVMPHLHDLDEARRDVVLRQNAIPDESHRAAASITGGTP